MPLMVLPVRAVEGVWLLELAVTASLEGKKEKRRKEERKEERDGVLYW